MATLVGAAALSPVTDLTLSGLDCNGQLERMSSSVPLPPASKRGLISEWACHMDLSAASESIKAAAQALDAIGMFLIERLQA